MKRLILILFLLSSVCAVAQTSLSTFWTATASGTDTYTVTVPQAPGFAAATAGYRTEIIFTNANTGASTLNLSWTGGTWGAITLRRRDGTALSAGDIKAGAPYWVKYNGNQWRMDNDGTISSFALTDGSGTTANGTAVDLGGTTTGAVNVSTSGAGNESIVFGGSGDEDVIGLGISHGSDGGEISLTNGNSSNPNSSAANMSSGSLRVTLDPDNILGGGAGVTIAGSPLTLSSFNGSGTGALTVNNLGVLARTATTGTGSVVMSNSPALVTPNLGVPSVINLQNGSGLPLSTGVTGLGTGVQPVLAVSIGSPGSVVVNGGALGTPSSGVATNLTGTAAGLTAGTVTTNANLTGDVTSVGNASTLTINTTSVNRVTGLGPNPSSGAGTEASPFTDADNTADIQTQVDALDATTRGGKIVLDSKRYDISSSSGVVITDPAVNIEGLSGGKQENPNGEFEGTTGTKISFTGNGFELRAPTTPRLSFHLRNTYLYSPTALQAASVNGSTGVGTKGVWVNGYGEQASFRELKTNNLDFGFFLNTGSGAFSDVINFDQNLILGGRYGHYFGSSGAAVYMNIRNSVIADNIKHGLYVNNNDGYYHWITTGNSFVRSSGASGILDNPSNVFFGANYSSFSNNIVTGAGLDFYPTPTQYTADGLIVSGDFNSITGNVIRGNLGGGSTTGLRVSGNSNYAVGNIFQGNTANVIFDSGATSNWIETDKSQVVTWTDNGTRNFVNGVSKNAGDPASAGVWNGATKNAGTWIWDTSNSFFYHYVMGAVNQNVRIRYTAGSTTHTHLGTGATDQAAIGASNSTHATTIYTTTAAHSTLPSRSLLLGNGSNGFAITRDGSFLDIDLASTGITNFRRSTANTSTVSTNMGLTAISSGDMADGFGGAFQFGIQDAGGGVNNQNAYIGMSRDGNDTSGKLQFATSATGSSSVKMNISASGNVAIGKTTTSATDMLEVNGTISSGGNSTAAGQLKILEDTDNGSNYTAFTIGSQSANITYTLPTTAPAANGDVLTSTTGGAMSWVTRFTTNATTVGLSSATLNSTYPDVPVGFSVICGAITLGGAIYTKYSEAGSSDVWLIASTPVVP